MQLSVILCTHAPHPGRLARTLAGLAAQTLPADEWETLVIDNASIPSLYPATLPSPRPSRLHLLREPHLGLTSARRCGLRAAQGEVCVLVDDDNVLAPGFLAAVVRLFAAEPTLGAAGGPSRPEFDAPPPAWAREFFPLLALRDLDASPQFAALERSRDGGHVVYPPCAPIGAGMALRRAALGPWLVADQAPLSDRRGRELTSGGDNDIVLTLLHAGWQVAYFPELALTHLIPASRMTREYLARLNRGIAKSWIQVLAKHQACPWPAIPRWSVPLRQWKAWFACHTWSGPAAYVRWQGACGHFEGRVRPRRPARLSQPG